MTESEIITTRPYSSIYGRIKRGANKAVPVKDLCDATGLSDRALRKLIENMRECGVCIISDKNGYYLPETEDELARYILRTEKTAKSYFVSLKAAKSALDNLKGENQLTMPI